MIYSSTSRVVPKRWDTARMAEISANTNITLAEEGLADWVGTLDREERR